MELEEVTKRHIGVTFDDKGNANVLVWAPHVTSAEILVQNIGKSFALAKEAYGYWKLITSQIQVGDLYKIVLDGEKQLPDPASVAQPGGVHGPSKALDLQLFAWSDQNWKNLALQDYILYELHTGTFTPQGTFAGIEEKLDFLKDLGVNAIEIMPLAQFPGTRNWGYDGVFPFAVQDNYGGAEGLQRLVNKCHEKGLAVILDVVYNHLGPEGNYLGEFGPYFTSKYNTPWGNAVNFDDEWCDGVRNFFVENALMWFRDFHIDALRLDAVHAIKDFSATHILREIKQKVNSLMQETGRFHYLIVELDLNDTRFINPLDQQGFGMDAQWVDEFHHALRVTAGEPRTGYYSDFTGIAHLAKAYQDAYVYDGQYSPHRKKKFGIKAKANPGRQFIVFSQNHDQVGNRMLGERTSTLLNFEMQKLMAGAVLVSPYLPMLFMGEEWGETHPFQYFVSHTDADLADAVRKGRKEEFAAFHAEGEAPDPMAETTFFNSKLQWDLKEQGQHKVLREFYKELISLRKQHPALRVLDRSKISVSYQEDENTLVLHRWQGEIHLICFMNFSAEPRFSTFPNVGEEWLKVLVSSDKKWGGPADTPNAIDHQKLHLQPQSIAIFSTTYE